MDPRLSVTMPIPDSHSPSLVKKKVTVGSVEPKTLTPSPLAEVKKVVKGSFELKESSASPLSLRSKQMLVEELKKIDMALLKPALVAAALNEHAFPTPVNHKLANLQLAYREQQGNILVAPHLRQAIIGYVESELLTQLHEYFTKSFKEEDWNSAFLTFLCHQLKIKIEEEPLVEAEIQDGKIYWRIKQGEAVLYDRQHVKGKAFEFSPQAWLMPWQLFRTFKDSGKRSSSVAITRELFVARFTLSEQHQAAQVWQELKEIGILNSRNRLSHGWRALSSVYLKLKTLPDGWAPQRVLDAIHLLTDTDHTYTEEKIPGIPGARIYRPERAKKTWAKTGRITNAGPTSETASMKIWDVAVYSDATAHHDKKAETPLGDKITYDHIPSGCVLREKFKETSTFITSQQYETSINDWKQQLQALELSYQTSFNQSVQGHSARMTREQHALQFAKMNPEFEEKKRTYTEHIANLQSEKDKIVMEDDKDWWTVAIPVKLHKQGETFLQSKKEQKEASAPPFLREVRAYLDMLEARGEEFIPNSKEEYIKALGAFRYLYRMNVKAPSNIVGQYSIGSISQTLFCDPIVKCAIDQLITERMKRFLDRREGSTHSVSAIVPSA